MYIDSAKASQLATTAREIGAEVLEGNLRYPSGTGGWQLGDVDLHDYLGRHRDQRLMLILVPAGKAETVWLKTRTISSGVSPTLNPPTAKPSKPISISRAEQASRSSMSKPPCTMAN